MIMTRLTFDLQDNSEKQLVNVFKTHGIFDLAIDVPGCQSLYMVQSEVPNRVEVIGIWESPDSYRGWLEHPKRGVATDDIASLIAKNWDAEKPGAQLEVLLAKSRGGGV